MATRSAIGYQNEDKYGSIVAVYCHWDGSPNHHLPILNEHYNTLTKVKALIAPGSISSLRTNRLWNSETVYEDRETYKVAKNEDDTCKCFPQREPQPLYYYERSEDERHPAEESHSLFYAQARWRRANCEYLYVFVNGEWTFHKL